MAEFIFTPVNYADGVPFYYAKNICDQRLFRWEPVATRLRWGEAGDFRAKIAARQTLAGAEGAPGGILLVVGPVIHQGHTLIGWEARPGRPLLPQLPGSWSLEERITALQPLLRSYQSYHRRGLTVGCPDWRRISLGPAAGPAPFRTEDLTVLFQEVADPGFPDERLPGGRQVWSDLLTAKEERRAVAATLLTHPLVQVSKVTPLWQEDNAAHFEVDLVWYHWRDHRWQTMEAREQIKMVRRGSRWEIVERQRIP